MKLSSQEEYGLRCLLQIGRHEQLTDESLTIAEISQAEGLSAAYVGKLMRLLRLGGFLESVRGQSGGYWLSRPPDQIIIGEVLSVLGGRLFTDAFCEAHAGVEELCTHSVNCSIRSLWNTVQFIVDRMLNQISLQDLLGEEQDLSNCLQNMADDLLQVSSA